MRASHSAAAWTFLFSILFGALLSATTFAKEYDEIKLSARLVAGSRPDQALLKITAKLIDDWHIYSTTQPAGGPKRTVITLKESPHFKPGAKYTPDQEPEVKFNEAFPGVPVEEHSGQVTWTNELQLAQGVKLAEVAVAGTLNGQVCTEQGACIPVKIEFAAVGQAAAAPADPSASNPLAPNPLAPNPLAPNPLAPNPLAPSVDTNPLAPPPAEKVEKTESIAAPKGEEVISNSSGTMSFRGEIVPAGVGPGGKGELKITITPGKDYHVYAWAATDPKMSAKPTLIFVTDSGPLKVGAPQTASEIHSKPGAEKGEAPLRYHEGAVTWTLPIAIPADAKPGDYPIAGMVGGQVCTDTTCQPADGAKFTGTISIGSEKPGASPLLFTRVKYPEVAKAAPTYSVSAPADPAGEQVSALKDPLNLEQSLGYVLGIAFAGGFILNFMPCVLPVVGLKLLSFAKQAGQDRTQAFALNFAYAAGQFAIFMVLATAAVTLNMGWGTQFQSVAFLVTLTGFMFALSLSFLGVWEIPVPGFGSEDKVSELAEGEGLRGAFFQGILTTILSTPCSGPMLGFVFGFCLKQPPYMTFLVFSIMALGMSLPYLVIGLEPSLIRFLPKPGEWMNTLRAILGFIMLAGVAAFVTFSHADYVLATLEVLVLVGFACWLIGKIPAGSEWRETWPTWAGAGATVAIGAAISFFLLGPSAVKIKWREYSPPLAQKLQKDGQTVMIDFTANWCPNCRVNKRWVIETPEVAKWIESNGVVPVLADWTDESEEIQKHLNELDANSIPLLAIYPAGKPGEVIVLRDLITQSQLLDALQKAGPSQATAAREQKSPAVVMSGAAE